MTMFCSRTVTEEGAALTHGGEAIRREITRVRYNDTETLRFII